MKSETLTLVLVNLAGITERADESLWPGVYRDVGLAFRTDLTRLCSLTLFRSIDQSSCYLSAVYLVARHNRAHISSGSAIPLAAILLLMLPYDPSAAFTHGLVLFVMGCSIS
ncbi:hypothetical protein TorRG33x02_329250 [Trema orientale]|uniref:Uncharacterized protein n=1 Tax=Trema orientale TaxID=63057 RepID=A0A2P5B8Y9_TREOI|nr:hypothetical protein TorRG33x02_329250 [Trema orientale]